MAELNNFDRNHIGHRFDPYTVDVEMGAIRNFAKAIGETDPIYFDEAAAKSAGHRSLKAPPTFISSLLGLSPDFFPVAELLSFDADKALHGSHKFEYFSPIFAGDRLTICDRIADIFDKKNGALNFVVTETELHNTDGKLVALSHETLVVKAGNP